MFNLSNDRPLTLESLVERTVPQLKAICKERKIPAYSKLQKAAIIQKILEHSRREILKVTSDDQNAITGRNLEPASETSKVSSQAQAQSDTHGASDSVSSSLRASQASCNGIPLPGPLSFTAVIKTLGSSAASKRTADVMQGIEERRKKQTISGLAPRHRSRDLQLSAPHAVTLDERVPNSTSRISHESREKATAGTSSASTLLVTAPLWPLDPPSAQAHIKKINKRFIPLVVRGRDSRHAALKSSLPRFTWPQDRIEDTSQRYDLDFDNPPLLPLQAISMPPSLSQRKHVTNLSIIFSFISLEDLSKIVLCSRLFRYAAHLSAVHRLTRDYHGARLASMFKRYSLNTTNMWPYLRARQEESLTRQNIFRISFLGRAFPPESWAVSKRLWASPDNVQQATIAVRWGVYLFEIQPLNTKRIRLNTEHVQVVDVQEIVQGEIWRVESLSSRGREILYVLEATCEAIGHPEPGSGGEKTPYDITPLRADWSSYVKDRMLRPKNAHSPSLIERLKWTNYEEYHRGISKLWLSKMQTEGAIGAAKRIVAERYVLACVVSNSISGRWMSSSEMAQESNELPSKIHYSQEDTILNLYLPAHHLVESLHFMTSDRKPLHTSVAVVQTPGREYFILKDNGMQIGCEEDGVAEVWMKLLACDERGRYFSQ